MGLEPHPAILMAYSWFCVQRSFLAGFKGPFVVPGMNSS